MVQKMTSEILSIPILPDEEILTEDEIEEYLDNLKLELPSFVIILLKNNLRGKRVTKRQLDKIVERISEVLSKGKEDKTEELNKKLQNLGQKLDTTMKLTTMAASTKLSEELKTKTEEKTEEVVKEDVDNSNFKIKNLNITLASTILELDPHENKQNYDDNYTFKKEYKHDFDNIEPFNSGNPENKDNIIIEGYLENVDNPLLVEILKKFFENSTIISKDDLDKLTSKIQLIIETNSSDISKVFKLVDELKNNYKNSEKYLLESVAKAQNIDDNKVSLVDVDDFNDSEYNGKTATLIADFPKPEDIDKDVVRIDPLVMKDLGINPGDVIGIRGRSLTYATVGDGLFDDAGKNIIRIDYLLRDNAGISIGDTVDIEKVGEYKGDKVVLAPLEEMTFYSGFENDVKKQLFGRLVHVGKKAIIKVRPDPTMFVVIETRPKDPVRIVKNTKIELIESPPDNIPNNERSRDYSTYGKLSICKTFEAMIAHMKSNNLHEAYGNSYDLYKLTLKIIPDNELIKDIEKLYKELRYRFEDQIGIPPELIKRAEMLYNRLQTSIHINWNSVPTTGVFRNLSNLP